METCHSQQPTNTKKTRQTLEWDALIVETCHSQQPTRQTRIPELSSWTNGRPWRGVGEDVLKSEERRTERNNVHRRAGSLEQAWEDFSESCCQSQFVLDPSLGSLTLCCRAQFNLDTLAYSAVSTLEEPTVFTELSVLYSAETELGRGISYRHIWCFCYSNNKYIYLFYLYLFLLLFFIFLYCCLFIIVTCSCYAAISCYKAFPGQHWRVIYSVTQVCQLHFPQTANNNLNNNFNNNRLIND